nr:PAS domain-containing sensor histidine kinase [Ramlibacter albus]
MQLFKGSVRNCQLVTTLGTRQWPVEVRAVRYEADRSVWAHLELHDIRHRLVHFAQQRARVELRQELIEAIPLPLSLRDDKGRFVRVNRAFEDWHDVRRAQVLGRTPSDVLPASVTLAFARCDKLALANGEPVDEELELRPSDGVVRNVQLRVHAIRQHGALLGIIAIEADVTRLREQEGLLTVLHRRLDRVSASMIDAQERERRRVAQDLHDDVGQVLTALKLAVDSLAQGAAPAQTQDLRHVAYLIDESLHRVRDVTANLYPHVLDDLGLEPALGWLIERFVRPALPDVSMRCRLERKRTLQDIELCAFRVVQEALTNVVRHSRATRAGVLVEDRSGCLHIEVLDNGSGFETGASWFVAPGRNSLGLASMQQRVEELDGYMQLESTVGSGTSIRVRLPWPAADAATEGGAA